MTKRLTVQERVATGACELDARLPGWEDKINVRLLDLGDECGCILGQLDAVTKSGKRRFTRFIKDLGNYSDGLVRLFGGQSYSERSTLKAIRHGFEERPIGHEYRDRTKAWKREVRARRRAKVQS